MLESDWINNWLANLTSACESFWSFFAWNEKALYFSDDNLNEETRELSRTREYSFLESRLRTLGGLDGLSSRQICNGKKFEECVYKLDQITPGSDDAFYKLNGYFSLVNIFNGAFLIYSEKIFFL